MCIRDSLCEGSSRPQGGAMTAGVTSITKARTAQRSVAQRRSANARYAILLLVPVALLTVIGLGAIRSASSVVGIELYGDGWAYFKKQALWIGPVSYTHLRAHETVLDLVCRLLLEKKK